LFPLLAVPVLLVGCVLQVTLSLSFAEVKQTLIPVSLQFIGHQTMVRIYPQEATLSQLGFVTERGQFLLSQLVYLLRSKLQLSFHAQ
jgi:hypothetical protein